MSAVLTMLVASIAIGLGLAAVGFAISTACAKPKVDVGRAGVVHLDDHRRGWTVSHAACVACGRYWVATIAPGFGEAGVAAFLECPGCHKMRGIRTGVIP